MYKDGISSDHSAGDATLIVCSISVLADEEREKGVSTVVISLPDSFLTTDRKTIFFVTARLFSIEIRTLIVADAESTEGVVIYVPHWAICTGLVIFNQTWRYMPEPEYQRLLG